MKKAISLLFFVTFNLFLFAESPLESFKKKYADSVQSTKIESIGKVGELSLFIIVSEENWWEQAVFFNSKTNVTKEIPEITEQAILSAKIVRTKKIHSLRLWESHTKGLETSIFLTQAESAFSPTTLLIAILKTRNIQITPKSRAFEKA